MTINHVLIITCFYQIIYVAHTICFPYGNVKHVSLSKSFKFALFINGFIFVSLTPVSYVKCLQVQD
jgi:hypothetical protein